MMMMNEWIWECGTVLSESSIVPGEAVRVYPTVRDNPCMVTAITEESPRGPVNEFAKEITLGSLAPSRPSSLSRWSGSRCRSPRIDADAELGSS